ncbi:hypothetical protein [Aquitalea aquatilis]|uniref:hypothetical protein n=1 Tax=Aquitalea aquatilis TaxID=1537400 RepID=UPI0010BD9B77|nr:hypothetical protein [Aquitalea aquatilis]
MSSTDSMNAQTANIQQDGPTRDFIQFSTLGQLLDMMLEENDDGEWIEYIEKQISQMDALEDKILTAIRKSEICAEIWHQKEITKPHPRLGFNYTLLGEWLQHQIKTPYGRAILRNKEKCMNQVYISRVDFENWIKKAATAHNHIDTTFDNKNIAPQDNLQNDSSTTNPIANPKGKIAWREALIKNWNSMLKAHDNNEPIARKILQWLKENDTEGTFKQNGNEDEFYWVMANGKPSKKPVGLKTFSNAISDMKRDGSIPKT